MSVSSGTSIDLLLRPLEAIDLPSLYARHTSLVDFFLYLALFNGVAQVAFVKRLEGRGGRLVAGAIGAALAIAMTGLEAAVGFSLLSLGPLAAGILLLLVGVGIYRTVRLLGAAPGTAAMLSLTLVALGIRAGSPRLADLISSSFPFLDLVVGGGVLFLLWKGLRHLVPGGGGGRLEALARKIGSEERSAGTGPGSVKDVEGESRIGHLRRELREEKPEIGRRLKRITKKERKTCREIRSDLSTIRSLLERGAQSGSDRKKISDALLKIPPARHQLRGLVDSIRDLDQRLGRFDLALLRELRVAWEKLPPADRPVLQKLALEERAKLQSEQRIATIEEFVRSYDADSAGALERAATAISANAIPDAIGLIRAAEARETEAEKKVEEVLEIERQLRRIMRLELRQTRQAT